MDLETIQHIKQLRRRRAAQSSGGRAEVEFDARDAEGGVNVGDGEGKQVTLRRLKEDRDAKKRRLGIASDDQFLARRAAGLGREEVEEMEDDIFETLSAASEEPEERQVRDNWLDEVAEYETREQGFTDQMDRTQIHNRLLTNKEKEAAKTEQRLTRRCGQNMTFAERVCELQGLLLDNETPAEALIRIKAAAVTASEAGLSRKELLKRRKGFQKPTMIRREDEEAMSRITDLCDLLVFDGVDSIYTLTKSKLPLEEASRTK